MKGPTNINIYQLLISQAPVLSDKQVICREGEGEREKWREGEGERERERERERSYTNSILLVILPYMYSSLAAFKSLYFLLYCC